MSEPALQYPEASCACARKVDPEIVHRIICKHPATKAAVIAILEEIQAALGYLPPEALKATSAHTRQPLVDVYGVATFYRAFSLTPRGEHLISVCQGTACHVRGAPRVIEAFEQQLGIQAGGTTADDQFTLETVNCLGACAMGPMVVADGHYFSKVRTSGIRDLLDRTASGLDASSGRFDEKAIPVAIRCPRCNHSLMDPSFIIDGNPSIRMTVSFGMKHGWIRLSSLYGSYKIYSEYEVPLDTVVNFFCPHCHAELAGAGTCAVCGASMVPMMIQGGGVVQICSRRGCKNHMLDLV